MHIFFHKHPHTCGCEMYIQCVQNTLDLHFTSASFFNVFYIFFINTHPHTCGCEIYIQCVLTLTGLIEILSNRISRPNPLDSDQISLISIPPNRFPSTKKKNATKNRRQKIARMQRCSVLQCVAVCCSVMQCDAV